MPQLTLAAVTPTGHGVIGKDRANMRAAHVKVFCGHSKGYFERVDCPGTSRPRNVETPTPDTAIVRQPAHGRIASFDLDEFFSVAKAASRETTGFGVSAFEVPATPA